MTSNASTKLFSDSGQNRYESTSKTDSGFISGANLISEENLTSEDGFSEVQRKFQASTESNSIDKKGETESCCMQVDSGIDVGLNEQLSGLNLDGKADGKGGKHSHLSDSDEQKEISFKSNSTGGKQSEIAVTEPWELYFRQDEEGDTQLHIAVIQGFIEVVYSLIRMVPHPCFLDIFNDVIQAPLHLAVLTHQPQVVRRLVVAGACLETRDRHGNTPLHLACQMGDVDCVKSLTEPISVSEIATANLLYSGYAQRVPQDFEERNYEGETCLHLAAYGGHTEILRHLIWFGADINARENKSGRTILHYAVESSNHKLLRFLLDECPYGSNGLLLDVENYAGRTAYQLARVLDGKMARDLVSRGADKNVEDIDEEEDDHPDHNGQEEMEDETAEMVECLHLESGNYQQRNRREPLSV